MRFFKAEVATLDRSFNVGAAYELGDLFDQVGRRAVVAPESSRRRQSRWFGDEERAVTFPVLVFAMDVRATADDVEQIVRDACEVWEIAEIVSVTAREASFCDDFAINMNWFQSSTRPALQLGNLFELYDFIRARRVFKDWKVALADPGECLEAAASCACSRALSAEAERILGGARCAGEGAALPVHYLVEGCERADHEHTLGALLGSLLAAERLPSEHALLFNFDNLESNGRRGLLGSEELRGQINDSLGFALAGNVVVAQYGRQDRDGSYDEVAYAGFCRFVEVMRPHLDTTLVVFSVPSGNVDLKRRIRRLASVPLVEIPLDAAPDARRLERGESLEALEGRARGLGLEPDARLAEMLDEALEDASFSDLGDLLEDWRRAKLVGERFPEYSSELAYALELRGTREPDALARLDELIGLAPVKRQIRDVLDRFKMNREAERLGLPSRPFSMHMVFVGPAGTGKTKVAGLYAEALKEARVLSEGRLVSVSGTDLDQTDVTEVFERARGSVLFVDEAYAMRGSGTIAEFIACMENMRDEVVVILAGYEGHMDALLDRNPGFRSRIGFTLSFPEYSPEELLEIFELMCRRADITPTEEARREARDLLARSGRRADQGNARYVRKLFEDAVGAQQVRLARDHADGAELTRELMSTLEVSDVAEAASSPEDGEAGEPEASAREELDSLIGLSEVKGIVDERIDFLRVQKARRDAGLAAEPVPAHMAFTGPPGVGKTEVGRLLGRILGDEAVLSAGGFYECTGASLNVPMPGMSEAKVRALFQKARGSVIFIDEAYSMLQHAHGADNEAVTALIAEMERYRDEVVVILAGYEREIEELLQSNPGFASRVRTRIAFPDYSPDELVEIFELMLEKRGLVAGEGVADKVRAIMARASQEEDFGNARFARNLVEDALLRQASRLARDLDADGGAPDPERLSLIEADDVEWEPSAKDARPPIGFVA